MKNFILVILCPFCSLQFLPSLVGIADSETEQLGSQSGSFGVVCVCVCVCLRDAATHWALHYRCLFSWEKQQKSCLHLSFLLTDNH